MSYDKQEKGGSFLFKMIEGIEVDLLKITDERRGEGTDVLCYIVLIKLDFLKGP